MSVTLHTLSNFVIISLIQEGEQVGSGQHDLSNLHFRGMEGVIARPEEDANTLGRDASWRFPKVW